MFLYTIWPKVQGEVKKVCYQFNIFPFLHLSQHNCEDFYLSLTLLCRIPCLLLSSMQKQHFSPQEWFWIVFFLFPKFEEHLKGSYEGASWVDSSVGTLWCQILRNSFLLVSVHVFVNYRDRSRTFWLSLVYMDFWPITYCFPDLLNHCWYNNLHTSGKAFH